MYPDQSRAVRSVFKVWRYRLKYLGTKFVPGLGFGENSVSQRAGDEATFLGVANLEDQLHEFNTEHQTLRQRLLQFATEPPQRSGPYHTCQWQKPQAPGV